MQLGWCCPDKILQEEGSAVKPNSLVGASREQTHKEKITQTRKDRKTERQEQTHRRTEGLIKLWTGREVSKQAHTRTQTHRDANNNIEKQTHQRAITRANNNTGINKDVRIAASFIWVPFLPLRSERLCKT